jgi:CheY-like chemotaxis protein
MSANITELSRVACADDDETIRLLLELALSEIGGLDVALFSSGHDLIEGFIAHQPQLVVLDVTMPVMDGFETLERLRSLPQFVGTPFIFMTANDEPRYISQYVTSGAIEWIIKPFNPIKLAAVLRKSWRKYNEADLCEASVNEPRQGGRSIDQSPGAGSDGFDGNFSKRTCGLKAADDNPSKLGGLQSTAEPYRDFAPKWYAPQRPR